MLQFDEYKVKLNNLRPELDELDQALGLEAAVREAEMLESESASEGFWDNLEKAQKVQQRVKHMRAKIDGQHRRKTQWERHSHLPRGGGRHRGAGLGPDALPHVHPLGGAPRLHL